MQKRIRALVRCLHGVHELLVCESLLPVTHWPVGGHADGGGVYRDRDGQGLEGEIKWEVGCCFRRVSERIQWGAPPGAAEAKIGTEIRCFFV